MEVKKYPEADINRKSGMFLSLGFVITLAAVIFAFEYKSYDNTLVMNLGSVNDEFEELTEIPPTEQPPPPPPPKVIQQPEIIEVPDEEEIEEEIEVDLDMEIDEDEVFEEIEFSEEPEEEVEEIFTIVEDQPAPEGGMTQFYKYINDNLKYPPQARRMGIEGRVFVQFVVDKDGRITEVQAIKGIGAGCDEEAVRVIKNSKPWKPGKQRGRPVKVRMVLPIVFKLS